MIRLLISIVALKKWKILQIDLNSAFLNGFLDEEVYVEQPEGYVVRGHKDKVLRLKKALYGLKQAPRVWNSRIDKYFQEKGFKKCPHEHALYVKMNGKCDILIVCLYVDDLIFTGKCAKMFVDFKEEMAEEFEMIAIGLMSYYLGIEVKQRDDGIFISQEIYAKEVLKRFNMENYNPISIPIDIEKKLWRHVKGGPVDQTLFKVWLEV
ncbi:hypothetical protein RJ639_040013 [Escallonia herrerae]|uniref:Reverse transcriptase Ty1/copia-type domain-containing protein n=1 Tax=Escallonia herrerae TaxID=1293975 RepID=A0AA88WJM0_9ASTE|nr:hypothetical protein RJ639_040013 [Escallonia herrerae]